MALPPLEDKIDSIGALVRICKNLRESMAAKRKAYKNNIKQYKDAKQPQQKTDAKAAAKSNLADCVMDHNMRSDFLSDLAKALADMKPLIEERNKWIKDMRKKWDGTLEMVKAHNALLKANKKTLNGKPMNPPVKDVEKMFVDQESLVKTAQEAVDHLTNILKDADQIHQKNALTLRNDAVELSKLP